MVGQPKKVLESCDLSVSLEPKNSKFLSARGVAKALSGDISGAIDDLRACIDKTENKKMKELYQGWIESLRKGDNPFTPKKVTKLYLDGVFK